MIELDILLSYEIEEVLRTPLLRGAVIGYCSKLYYGGRLVKSCDSSIRDHFRHLQIDGIATQKRLANMKYILNPGLVIVFDNQTYNTSTMTDEIAEAYLEKFPKAIVNFKVNNDFVEQDQKPEQTITGAPVKRSHKKQK